MPDLYDVIVVGAGSTGTNVAWYARDNGLSVAVIERELVGGECSYWACIPSKALLGPSSALAAARRLPGASAAVTGELDVDAVLARRDSFIADLDDGGSRRLRRSRSEAGPTERPWRSPARAARDVTRTAEARAPPLGQPAVSDDARRRTTGAARPEPAVVTPPGQPLPASRGA